MGDLAFHQTIHASANGVELVEAVDFAAMRTALGIGTTDTPQFNGVSMTPRPVRAGLVTFQFDDGFESIKTLVKPVFDAKGVVGCIAVPTTYVGTAGKLTAADMLDFQADGWEILGHSVNHADLTTYSEAQLRVEFAGNITGLEALGLTDINSFVYPGGYSNALVRRIIREYFRSARGYIGGVNTKCIDTYHLWHYWADTVSRLDLYKGYVDTAFADGRWLIFAGHDYTAEQAAMLGELIDYIVSLGMEIVTTDVALDRLGNAVDLGDNFAFGEGGFRGDLEGGVTTLAVGKTEVATGYVEDIEGFILHSQTVDQSTYPSQDVEQIADTHQTESNTGADDTFDTTYKAIKFTADGDHVMRAFGVRLKASAALTNPIHTITGSIYSDNAGVPGTLIAGDQVVRYGTLTTSYATYSFSASTTLVSGTSYWLVLTRSAAPAGGTISVGIAASGTGLHAYATTLPTWTAVDSKKGWFAIYGRTAAAIYGFSTNSYGVHGVSTHSIGVNGISTNSNGVYGSSVNLTGVSGYSANEVGVRGNSLNGTGVFASSTNGIAVYASSSANVCAYYYRAVAATTSAVIFGWQGHASGTAPVCTLRQEGTGNILEMQEDGTNRVVVDNTGEVSIISNTVGLKLDASGTTTIISDGTTVAINKPVAVSGNVRFPANTATINTTASPNTCTVNLAAGNHWTIPASTADDSIAATITVPSSPCAGVFFIPQGATPRDITWAVSAGTLAWIGTEPTWTDASEASEIHLASWAWDGTYFYLSDAGKTSITA